MSGARSGESFPARRRWERSMRVAFSPHYSFDLGPGHPFPMGKYARVHDLLREEGTIAAGSVMTPGPATREALCRVHTAGYVTRFLEGGLAPVEERRLGFRWSPALCRRALHATAGTLLAARAALAEGAAANLAGGSHHAFAGHGEGYCAFHDMAVAIRSLRAEGRDRRVAIVDLDVHQGNGSAALLRDDPRVFTLSIHCESNYPREKVPGSRDVGLPDGLTDDAYLAALEEELSALWRQFRPEVVFYQAGVDPLAGDRFGRLTLTREGLRRRDATVIRRCLATSVPIVIVLGGGYAATLEATADAHADTIRAARALLRGEPWPM
jgi:acetoin utilization deacetylase AcuC-like enzyme